MVRFSVAYATTVPALFVLCLAIAGLLACLCQYILLKTIEREVPQLTNQVGAFADKVMVQLNNASQQWAVGTNDIINQTNTKINEDVFGWVNTTTGAMNHTLNVFVDGMMTALNGTFGGTPLYDPVLEVLNCLVLLKVQGIEKALTWVSDHAYITFPEMPVDTFSLGAVQKMSQNGDSSLLATGPAEDASDKISDAILTVVHHLESAIRQEAIISTCVLLIWVIIVLIGIGHSAFMVFKPATNDISPVSNEHQEKHLDGFFPPTDSIAMGNVPTYEQATRHAGDSEGNKYNGQAYTLTPAPLPTFKIDQPTSPILNETYQNNEKMGKVGVQDVESVTHRPDHTRSSSYGNLAVTTPIEPTPSSKGFYLPRSNDPFADPR